MENILAIHPFESVHLGHLTIRVKGGKDAHMLVITNHFIQYAKALVTSSQTVKCTA